MTDDSQQPDDRKLPEGDQPEPLGPVGDASPAEDEGAFEDLGDPGEPELTAESESADDESEWTSGLMMIVLWSMRNRMASFLNIILNGLAVAAS